MLLRFACAFLLLVTTTGPALAFDTGHHSDLTRSVLIDLKFSDSAIKAVQVANWLTDFYSAPDSVVTPSEFEKLHADCLFSTADVAKYGKQLAINTKNAVGDAARANDEVKFLTILGLSLHTLQDFYTHSNWVERHPRGGPAYLTNTWWNSPVAGGVDIHTGWYKNALYPSRPPQAQDAHGDYTSGLNHDAYQRPRWDDAYVFAYAASAEWAAAACRWADEANRGFLDRVRAFSLTGQDLERLDYDMTATYRISEWISVPSIADGHWKGPGSGRIKKFPGFLAAWKVSTDSLSVKALKDQKYQLLLTKNLYGSEPQGALPAIPRVPLNKLAVAVRTLAVTSEGFRPLAPNFYAKVSLGDGSGQRSYIEGMQNRYTKSIEPAWWTIHFIDKDLLARTNGTIPIRYELHNEDEDSGYPPPRPGDEHFSIKGSNDSDKDIQFTFDVNSHACQGDIRGQHDSEWTGVVSKGRAQLRGIREVLHHGQ